MQRLTVTWLKAHTKATLSRVALVLYAITLSASASAAEFSISPISLQLPPEVRAGVVGINNKDKRPIRFQLALVEWTQNAKGEDVYVPSDDLIYFPRQITVQPGERGIARIGSKAPSKKTEKSYRLRVEELPEPLEDASTSALNLTITFAVPIFVGPSETTPKAVIAPMQLEHGKLTATIQNNGNAHYRIDSLELTGTDGYTEKQEGWYLLPQAQRDYVFAIPPEVCKSQKSVQLHVKVGDQLFNSALDVDPSLCGL